MNIVYVSHLLKWDGPELVGRSLVRHLCAEHNVRVCGAIVSDDSPLLQGNLAQQVVSASELTAAHVVYMEGGWNRSDGSPDRFPLDLATEFVRRGGQLIVADIDRNVARDDAAVLQESRALLGTAPSPNERGVQYLYDEEALGVGNALRFVPNRMWIDDSLKRAWDGIDSVLVDGAVVLSPSGAIVATGHKNTCVMVNDLFHAPGGYWPWAMMKQYGVGHVVVIGALFSGDFLVEACPDNARWVSNLMKLLMDRTSENSQWQGNRLNRELGHADPAKLLEEEEGQRHERKSSFLAPADADRQDVSKKFMQEKVGKSIAALANTDGGNVVIGQADDGSVVGLDADFRVLGRRAGRDGFEQELVQYIANAMWPSWES